MARERRKLFCRLAIEGLEDRTTPALFVVTSTADSGPGSLREMVAKANALPGPDAIRFELPAVPPIITLTSGEIHISDSVNILGANLVPTPNPNIEPVITISGNKSSRIFNLNGPGTLNVGLHGLRLTAGKTDGSGGAVLNVGENLTLNGCYVSNSTAKVNGGAIATVGLGAVNTPPPHVSLNHSRVFGNTASDGGAVHFASPGRLIVSFSTFDGNKAEQRGGAVSFANGGSFAFDSSTVSHNSAVFGGGVHFVAGPNSGPVTNINELMVRNSTFSGNVAKTSGGAVALAAFSKGILIVANSTVTGNVAGSSNITTPSFGGGFHVAPAVNADSAGRISLVSTVLSKNLALNGPDAFTPGILSASFSAIGSSAGIATFINSGNNLPFGVDLVLGPLANNGGSTFTHLPAADSPLINAGSNPFNLAFDQRGAPHKRVIGLRADIGAVERGPSVVPGPGPNPIIAPPDDDKNLLKDELI